MSRVLPRDVNQKSYCRPLNEVLEDATLSRIAILAYVALCHYADNDTGSNWYSQAKLAKMARLGVSSLKKALRELETAGVIGVEHRIDEKGDPDTNKYTVAPSWFAQNRITPIRGVGQRLTDGPSKVDGGVGQPLATIYTLSDLPSPDPKPDAEPPLPPQGEARRFPLRGKNKNQS
jgi:hypothetical protein